MLRQIRIVLDAIQFHHSVFALPFALISMLLAGEGWPAPGTILWIVLAAVFARSAAMGFNRWADADLDGRNPRTRPRAIPSGLLTRRFMLGFTLLNATLFILAAGMLNRLCLYLSLPCLGVLLVYSYSKRFTAASHLWLGVALGIAPIGAWIAVRGSIQWIPLLLGAAVTLWVAGFDILYACQDVEVDRREGLHSIPARMGIVGALWLSAALHLLAWLGFALVGWFTPLGVGYAIALGAAAVLLLWQHWIVRPGDLSHVNAAFFTANGLIAICLFAAAAVDLTWV